VLAFSLSISGPRIGSLERSPNESRFRLRAIRTTSPSLSPELSRSALRTLSSNWVEKLLVLPAASRP
jgi:hypothetical protein